MASWARLDPGTGFSHDCAGIKAQVVFIQNRAPHGAPSAPPVDTARVSRSWVARYQGFSNTVRIGQKTQILMNKRLAHGILALFPAGIRQGHQIGHRFSSANPSSGRMI